MSIEVKIRQNFNLAIISRRLLELAGKTLSVIGWKYVEETINNIEKKKLFKSRTGDLFRSISAFPVSETKVVIFGAGKDSPLEYGKYLEFGTKGPYIIRPRRRKYLLIPTPTGFRRKEFVIHPGIKARHYFFGDYEEKMKKAVEAGRLYFRNKLPEKLK